ncbi:hypothetical protein FNU76_21660 [Chitinimonas arctica]|uniref:Capsule assembly Wzi family protein n=1 Tax=Chitinimonas arctica TaxID=2594795 RepID=A0A516SKQ8_9NEIS|nr:hypothetical protein [Chitinimonas arctica]QDQ28747.1 hypothetical protein FNU76_21660 [Chitinimonas arctica]
MKPSFSTHSRRLRRPRLRQSCAMVLLALLPAASQASAIKAYTLGKDEQPIAVDGRLDESAWQQAPRHDRFAQYSPTAGAPYAEHLRTEARVILDGQAVVIGIRAWDKQAPRVVLSRRDAVQRDQDLIGVWLDPNGRRESAMFVKASLAGVVTDGMYLGADDEEDTGPDYPVQLGVQRLDDGYSMEIRLPLAGLRYPFDSSTPWQMTMVRAIPGAGDLMLVSGEADDNALNFLNASLPLEGTAETLNRHRRQSEGQAVVEWTGRSVKQPGSESREGNLGLEGWWRPRADWVFNATLNPDFAQVEIDAPQASGNRSLALALPEKRRYFLESADVLGLALPAFYSRTVGDLRWGLRGTWRGEAADASLLLLKDRAGTGVLRGRPWGTEAWVLDSHSQVQLLRARSQQPQTDGGLTHGLMAGQRKLDSARYNRVAGIDGLWHQSQDGRHLQAQWNVMTSQNTIALEDEGSSGRTAALARSAERGWRAWFKGLHNDDDWRNSAEFAFVSPEFVNLLGFSDQAGLWQAGFELNRQLGAKQLPLGEQGFPLHETELHLGLKEVRSLRDAARNEPGNEVIRREVRLGGEISAPGRSSLWLDAGADQQRAHSGGRLHATPGLHGGLETSPWPWLALLSVEGNVGRQLDSELDRVGSGGWWSASARMRWPLAGGRSIELDPAFSGVRIKGNDEAPGYSETGLRLLGLLHFNANSSLRVILQHEHSEREAHADQPASVERSSHRSLLWRHRLNPAWQVSTGLQWDRNDGRTRREWFVKLQSTFESW